MNSWGLYSVAATAEVHDDDINAPHERFVCTISLPNTNYTRNLTTVYYPGAKLNSLRCQEQVYDIKKLQRVNYKEEYLMKGRTDLRQAYAQRRNASKCVHPMPQTDTQPADISNL